MGARSAGSGRVEAGEVRKAYSWTEIARLVGQRNLSVNGGLHYEEGTSVNGVLISTC